MFEDVVAMRMNNGELIEVEQPLIAAAQIVSVLLRRLDLIIRHRHTTECYYG